MVKISFHLVDIESNQATGKKIIIIRVLALFFIFLILVKQVPLLTQGISDKLTLYTIVAASISCLLFSIFLNIFSPKLLNINDTNQAAFIESILFIGVFTNIILYSGGVNSPHKFIFLFIIVLETIRNGNKSGMAVAIISCLIILGLHLVTLNINFFSEGVQSDFTLCCFFIFIAWILGHFVNLDAEHMKSENRLNHVDSLTGTYNHRHFKEMLDKKCMIAANKQESLSLVLIDIDDFNLYNQTLGYQIGDNALKKIASVLINHTRSYDKVCRVGGEEFAILLPNTDREMACDLAKQWHQLLNQTHFKGEEHQPKGKLTISMGVSTYPHGAKSASELMQQSDDALYRAKFFNKNQIEYYHPIFNYLNANIGDYDFDLVERMKTLMGLLYMKDNKTYGHVERVVTYAKLLANELNLKPNEKQTLICGTYLHDIGKIGVPKEVLNKKMPLEDEEWRLLKSHADNGTKMLAYFENLKPYLPLVKHHHERFDGRGYPSQLCGDEIPYLVRILTVVDSFDAMTSQRSYNQRKSYQDGLEELRICSGAQFDPQIVEAFANAMSKHQQELEFI
ncbi:MAG: bifunctional diguanylate cyclase/phosphohydrolase [Turicibacter sp.]